MVRWGRTSSWGRWSLCVKTKIKFYKNITNMWRQAALPTFSPSPQIRPPVPSLTGRNPVKAQPLHISFLWDRFLFWVKTSYILYWLYLYSCIYINRLLKTLCQFVTNIFEACTGLDSENRNIFLACLFEKYIYWIYLM